MEEGERDKKREREIKRAFLGVLCLGEWRVGAYVQPAMNETSTKATEQKVEMITLSWLNQAVGGQFSVTQKHGEPHSKLLRCSYIYIFF